MGPSFVGKDERNMSLGRVSQRRRQRSYRRAMACPLYRLERNRTRRGDDGGSAIRGVEEAELILERLDLGDESCAVQFDGDRVQSAGVAQEEQREPGEARGIES